MSSLKIAFIGCGGMAGAHAKRLVARKEVRISALCDVSREVTDRFAQKNLPAGYAAPTHHTDVEEMLRAAKPDGVFIVSPHTLHFMHGMAALDAGVHVFMEKPMVTSSEQAYLLRDKAEATKRTLVVGYNTPCTPTFGWLRKTIREQTLGKLEQVVGYLSQNWRRGTTGSWRQDPKLSGGGQAYDSGAHLLNSIVWTVEQPVAAVSAFVDNMDTPVDINSVINIRFANGVQASVMVNGNCVSAGSHATYCFADGRVDIDPWGGGWMKVYGPKGEITDIELDKTSTNATDNFIDVLLGKAEPRTSPQNGVHQSELMDAIYESARKGRVIKPRRKLRVAA